MSVVRRHHNSNFTVVPNAIFEDARLSIEAKGTLGYLLSRPHDWTIRLTHIGTTLRLGRDKTERIFQELQDAGYVVRGKQRRVNGVWGPMEFVVFDDPAKPPAEQTVASLPHPEKPHAGEPHAVFQGTYKELKVPSTESTKAADDAHAREPSTSLISPAAVELSAELLRLQCIDRDDPRAVGTAYQVQTWLTKGWHAQLIVQAVATVMAKRSSPPRSLRYFESAIAEAIAEQGRPLPVATIAHDRLPRLDGGRGSGSVSDVLRSLANH